MEDAQNHADGKNRAAPQDAYDEKYFEKHCGSIPYRWDIPWWPKFFDDIAEELNRSLKPRTVLDVGCAIGFLIDAFWRRGVRAYGIDISEYAISQVPQDVRSFCRVLSATDPLPDDFPRTYDLITCIEVLEHIPEEDAKSAIKNMALRTDCILFSSTPNDLTEPTHVNVRPVIYWLQLFAEFGFYPDLRFDASFVCPQAFLLRKGIPRIEEDALPFFADSINKKFQIHAQLEQIAALTRSNKEIESLRQEVGRLNDNRRELEECLRRERNAEQERFQRILADQKSAVDELRQRFERQVSERDRKIDALQVTQSGLLWEALVSYRKTKDLCLPPNTKRRALYDYGLQSLKGIVNRARLSRGFLLVARHPAKTLKNLNRVNIDKFLYHVRHSDPTVLEAKIERKLGVDQSPRQTRPTETRKFALIISGCPGDAFRYRCEHQAEQLRFLGLTVDIAYFDQIDYGEALRNYEFFWLHRVPHTPGVEQLIFSAQKMGKPVIFDTDDLIFDEEKVPYVRALELMSQDEVDLFYDGVRRYHHTLSLCRFATVTTEPLRETIRQLFPNVQCFVNPNTLSDAQVAQAEEALRQSRPLEDKKIVRIAYLSGTRTHHVDFKECSSALVRILEVYPCVKLMLVGHLDLGGEFDRFGDRVERSPLVPWQQLPCLLRNVDINLAPLELNNPFTEAKSALKYFEAAVMGVPTIASDVKAYSGSIHPGENGFLCRTDDDWFSSMSRLVEDAELRREMGNRSKAEVLNQITTRNHVLRLKRIVSEILQTSPQNLRKRISIAFILRAPIAQVGGGYKNIFRLANYLADQGHEVDIYVEPIAHLEGKSDSEIVEFCHSSFGKSAAQIYIGHNAIKATDIAIATNWPTAFVVDSLMNTRCKAYLIQDFEPDFYEYESDLYNEAAKTYDLPLRKVTLGRHLARLFEEKDRMPVAFVDFGIDHSVFNPENRKKSDDGLLRILFFARRALKRRGYEIGIEALKELYKSYPQLQIYFYGAEENDALPFPYTNLGFLSSAELGAAMRNADIHLSFSLTNISFVPFEAMACGCAVVEAKVPSVEAMVEDGKHCLLAEPQPDAVMAALRRLIQDGDLRSRIAKAGMEFVREKTWENSCKQFEGIIYDSLLISTEQFL
jgi:glycosyltransferase involved in cell wall biosynthesis